MARLTRNTFAKNEYPRIYFSVKNTRSSRVVAYHPRNHQRLLSIASRYGKNSVFNFRVEYGKAIDAFGKKIMYDNEIETSDPATLTWAWKAFLEKNLLDEFNIK